MISSSITFFGGVRGPTGANFLFEIGGDKSQRVLVDCGLFQGEQYATEENRKAFAYDPASVQALFITHAHMDHIGRIPILVRNGYHGPIYSTPQTRSIAELMLQDALKIMRYEAHDAKQEPLYEDHDVARVFGQWNDMPYHTPLPLKDGVTVVAKDAGHILGSAFFEFERNGKKVVFSGDLGNTPSLLVRDTEPLSGASYLVIESVYGDRNHEDRDSRRKVLKAAVERSIAEKGVLVIPAFSLERSQMILYELNNMVEDGEVPSVPVFLDSPLAIKVTKIYREMRREMKQEVRDEIASGDDIFKFPKLSFTETAQESRQIDLVENPKIIIAGGGMSEGGRVIGHEQSYLPDARNTVLLVGHQAAGTLGRALLEGAKKVVIRDKTVEVRATIMSVTGYSSHKDSDHLVEFVGDSAETLKQVFVAMGEPKASLFLAQRISNEFGIKAVYPELGSRHEIEF